MTAVDGAGVNSPEPGPGGSQLDRNLVRGLAWTGMAKWGTQVVSWASTLVVAHLLTPADYGILGMAQIYLGLVQMVNEFGLGTAVIQNQDLSREQIAKIGGLSIGLGFLLCLASIAIAPMLGWFFHEPRVPAVLVALSCGFILTSFQVVPSALLTRELSFKRLAGIEGAEALVQTAVTLTLAVAGARYWSLVLGSLCGKAVNSALQLSVRRHPLAFPSRLSELRRSLGFGGRVVVSRVAWFVYSDADFAVVGKMLGTAALGAYTLAWNLASIPVDKVMGIVGRVAMPVFSQVQHDRPAVARYVRVLSGGLAFTVLPVSIGLALVAPDFVPVILGSQWKAAIVPLQLLSIHVTFRCLSSLFSQALIALDETGQTVRVGLAQVAILPLAFAIGAGTWGLRGVALSWILIHPIVVIPMLFGFTLRRTGMHARDLFCAIWPAISCTAIMVTAVMSVQYTTAGMTAVPRLLVSVFAGALAYAGALTLLYRPRIRQLRSAILAR